MCIATRIKVKRGKIGDIAGKLETMAETSDPNTVLTAVSSISNKTFEYQCDPKCCCTYGYWRFLPSLLEKFKGGVFYLLVDCSIAPSEALTYEVEELIYNYQILVSRRGN